jgi:hypothetical protein
MIRVEISCNRCNQLLGSATCPNGSDECVRKAWENALGKFVRQLSLAILCTRCDVYEKWLMLPADKRGPAPADPCARADR